MSDPQYLTPATGRRIAYHHSPGRGPGLVFLGGFRSDMTGTKAQFLQDWATAQGRAFLRFDYSGHGQSAGAFTQGCIGDWAADAMAAITCLTEGPQVLVGSSMGGWISLLVARAVPDKLAGLVTIAAAPDFTEDSMWAGFSDTQKAALDQTGQVALPSDYGADYIITKRLIEDGRHHLVLRQPLHLSCPVRLLQGTDDTAVTRDVALRLLDHLQGPDIRLTLVKGGDHSYSQPDNLAHIVAAIDEVLARIG